VERPPTSVASARLGTLSTQMALDPLSAFPLVNCARLTIFLPVRDVDRDFICQPGSAKLARRAVQRALQAGLAV